MTTATATATKKSYPYISAATVQKLRKRFHASPPQQVNLGYLRSLLDFDTDDAARSLLHNLVRVGLVDAEGKLTPLAFRWRDDDQYKAACDEILESGIYPQTLLDLYRGPEVTQAALERWFHNDLKMGVSAAHKAASFYMLLLEGDPAKLEPSANRNQPKATSKAGTESKQRSSNGKRAESAASTRPTAASAEALRESHENGQAQHATATDTTTTGKGHASHTLAPTIHLDFNIHIASDSSPELVEQIFASMAKHMRSLVGADE